MGRATLNIDATRMILMDFDSRLALHCLIVNELFCGGLKTFLDARGGTRGKGKSTVGRSDKGRGRWQAGKQIVYLFVVELHELNEN